LSPASRRAIDYATLMGRQFDTATLKAVLEADDAELWTVITELCDRRILEPVENADAFRFAHDKLREIPFASLPEDRRSEIHRRIAIALEASADQQGI